MKRFLSLLLIALLFVCPMLRAAADESTYIIVPKDTMTEEEHASLEARAREILLETNVAVYFVYSDSDADAETLIADTIAFSETAMPEQNALILSVNPSLYYIYAKGPLAQAVFPENMRDETLWEAFRSVRGDNAKKVLAYLDAAASVLNGLSDEIALTDGGRPAVVDRAELLSHEEQVLLSQRLVQLGRRYCCDIVVVTMPDLGGVDTTEYADSFFDSNGYGYGAEQDGNGGTVDGDGILLLVAMEERKFCMSTSGLAIDLLPDDDLETLGDQFTPYLNDGEYAAAFSIFADGCERLLGGEPASTSEPEPTVAPTAMPEMMRLPSGKLPIVDQAGLLTPDEVTALSEKLVSIANRYQCDIVIVTADGLGYKTATEYADDFFDYNGYGYGATPDASGTTINGDGILLLVSMEERDYAISTSGFGIYALTDYGIADLEERFLPELSRGDYAASFDTFADRCAWLLDTARKNKPYDVGYKLNTVAIFVAIVAGVLFAFIPVSAMKRKLTDVHKNTEADRYLQADTFAMTQNSDVFLNKHIMRSVHVEASRGGGGGSSGGSSTHTSSSGGTHGGHSGKF